MPAQKTAAIIGATGLIGGHLVKLLCEDSYFSSVLAITRRPVETSHPRLINRVIDFQDKNELADALPDCEIIFCSIGTTEKNVKGDQQAYRRVDYEIPLHSARAGLKQGLKQFLLVSSMGASEKSRSFYLNLKGETEKALREAGIPNLKLFRPSLLLGHRGEFRLAEKLSALILRPLSYLIPKKYRPVQAETVARAMIAASKLDYEGTVIYENKDILCLDRSKADSPRSDQLIK